jgi:hypothetical protein
MPAKVTVPSYTREQISIGTCGIRNIGAISASIENVEEQLSSA